MCRETGETWRDPEEAGDPDAPTAHPRAPARRAAAGPPLAVGLVYLVVVSFRRWDVLLVSVAALSALVVAAWFAVSRRGRPRAVALVVAVLALVLLTVVLLASDSLRVLVVGLLLAAASTASARWPFTSHRWTRRPHPRRRRPATRCSS